MSVDSVVDLHDKMRARDVSKVAKGEQATRPAHEPRFHRYIYISPSTLHQGAFKVKGNLAAECEKFAKYYRALCSSEWIERWNEQRRLGIFPGPF